MTTAAGRVLICVQVVALVRQPAVGPCGGWTRPSASSGSQVADPRIGDMPVVEVFVGGGINDAVGDKDFCCLGKLVRSSIRMSGDKQVNGHLGKVSQLYVESLFFWGEVPLGSKRQHYVD